MKLVTGGVDLDNLTELMDQSFAFQSKQLSLNTSIQEIIPFSFQSTPINHDIVTAKRKGLRHSRNHTLDFNAKFLPSILEDKDSFNPDVTFNINQF